MRRALAGLLGLAACAAAAALAWRALRPALPPQLIAVTVVLQGSTASNEAAVAVPLESALATTKGLTRLRTEVRASVVTALCFFEPGADGLGAAESVREAIDPRRLTLPDAASMPLVPYLVE